MPRLKHILDDLTRTGPTLDLRVEPTLGVQELLRAEGREIPSATLRGMIDTGASGTLIKSTVFEPLGIEPYAITRLRTASTTQPLLRGKYRVRVVLTEAIAFEVDAVEGPLIGQNVQCLIGRYILEYVMFTYDGPNSRFRITLK